MILCDQLYMMHFKIIPITKNSSKMKSTIEFVGPICESTCKFGVYRNYQKIKKMTLLQLQMLGHMALFTIFKL